MLPRDQIGLQLRLEIHKIILKIVAKLMRSRGAMIVDIYHHVKPLGGFLHMIFMRGGQQCNN